MGWFQTSTLLGTKPGVMQALQPFFQAYDLANAARQLTGVLTNLGYNAPQTNYLHTFNYGDKPGKPDTHNSNSYDHVEWNAWHQDMTGRTFTNVYLRTNDQRYALSAPNDGRQCLDDRITDIRAAYRLNAEDPDTAPQIVLVAHSQGTVLSHYYLIKSASDTGVRRFVSIAGVHLGSGFANYLLWYKHAGFFERQIDGVTGLFIPNILRFTGAYIDVPPVNGINGYFRYTDNGGVEGLSVNRQDGPAKFRHHNLLADFFSANPAPKLEYVFNVYSTPSNTLYRFMWATANDIRLEPENRIGDGLVPTWSASAKTNATSASIWNGNANTNGDHDIDPVIFGIWTNTDHSAAVSHTNSIFKSLFGVVYRWTGNALNPLPPYAQRYGEDQSFSKYFPTPASNSVAYTDEPGIGDLRLLDNRASGNPLLIPSFNTWSNSAPPQKTVTNATDFAGHQIIAYTSSGSVGYLGSVGTKNRSANPVGTSGTNYWVLAGNEYLPASMSVQASGSNSPITWATNASMLSATSPMVTNCLVQLDTNAVPQYQYGLFMNSVTVSGTNHYFVAAQGKNLAGLITPQAERAFDAPVDSATVVAILKKINQGEALTNCSATTPTQWKATVSEWVKSDPGTITLNFFPTSSTPNVYDAWTGAAYGSSNWSYSATTKTFTLNNSSNAPSQLIVSNQVYLGCDKTFTNSYGGIVSNLTDGALAGVPVNEAFLDQVRTALDGIIGKYSNTTASVAWTKPAILAAISPPNTTSNWTPVTSGLLLPKHFTELEAVTDLLTTEWNCTNTFCSNLCSIVDGDVDAPYSTATDAFIWHGGPGKWSVSGVTSCGTLDVGGTRIFETTCGWWEETQVECVSNSFSKQVVVCCGLGGSELLRDEQLGGTGKEWDVSISSFSYSLLETTATTCAESLCCRTNSSVGLAWSLARTAGCSNVFHNCSDTTSGAILCTNVSGSDYQSAPITLSDGTIVQGFASLSCDPANDYGRVTWQNTCGASIEGLCIPSTAAPCAACGNIIEQTDLACCDSECTQTYLLSVIFCWSKDDGCAHGNCNFE